MYEVAPSILESRLLGSNNILDAAVVAIPDKENGQVPRAFVVLWVNLVQYVVIVYDNHHSCVFFEKLNFYGAL